MIRDAVEHDVDMSWAVSPSLRCVAGIARSLGRPAVVHLELDSGLSRGGARTEDWTALVAAPARPKWRARCACGASGHTLA